MTAFHDNYQEYVKRMAQVRYLSTPSLDGIPDADGYSKRLRDNFVVIGQLAAQNRTFLQELLFPLIKEKHPLSSDQAEELMKSVIFPRLAKNDEIIQILLASGDWHSLRINFVEADGSMPVVYSSDESSGYEVWHDHSENKFDLKDYA